jgi:hypothetical protein
MLRSEIHNNLKDFPDTLIHNIDLQNMGLCVNTIREKRQAMELIGATRGIPRMSA